ncbi:hypothetical protein Tco_0129322 [Tanacetum coccineum]
MSQRTVKHVVAMFIPHLITMTLSGLGKEKLFKLRKLSLSKQCNIRESLSRLNNCRSTHILPAQIWDVPGPEGMYGSNSTYTTEGYGYGPDLNGKVVNESQYRGMIRSLINLTTSRPDIQFSIESYIEVMYEEFLEKALQMLASCLKASLFAKVQISTILYKCSELKHEDIVVVDTLIPFFPTQYQLADIFTKPLDEPTFKRLIVKLALENSKVSFSTLTGGIYGEVRVNTIGNAIGAHYLPHSSEYVAPLSIDIVRPWFKTIGYREAVPTKGTLKKSLLPPRWSLANRINIDYASILWEDIIIILNKKHREKVVPYTRFLSLLMMHKMKEGYGDGELTLYPTQVVNINN